MVLKVNAFGGAAGGASTLVSGEQSRVTSIGSKQVSGEESEGSEGYREHLTTGLR